MDKYLQVASNISASPSDPDASKSPRDSLTLDKIDHVLRAVTVITGLLSNVWSKPEDLSGSVLGRPL